MPSFPRPPGRRIDDNDPIFHVVYDLDDRYQILGMWALAADAVDVPTRRRHQGPLDGHLRRPEPPDGGHLLQLRCRRFLGMGRFPRYPEKFSALGIRLGVNYVVYPMTH